MPKILHKVLNMLHMLQIINSLVEMIVINF